MNCPNCWCCEYCCPREDSDEQGEKSSLSRSVKYNRGKEVLDMGAVVLPQFEKVPIERVFEFKQPRVPMPLHPQIAATSVITSQPRHTAVVPPPRSDSRSTISSAAEPNDPVLRFSLYYDIQRRTLTVHLIEAFNLPAKDRRGTSDPFVILFLLPNKEAIYETKVHKQTLNPKFDQVFEFPGLLPNEIRRQSLVLRILDKDTIGASDYIGSIVLPLEEADLYGVTVAEKINEDPNALQSDSSGDLLLSLSYNPTYNLIQGIVLKATNLQRMDISGSADPYIKIYLMFRGERKGKWRSSVKKKTLVPIYNEQFQFDVTEFDISHTHLDVYVMDFDRLSRNDVMGSVLLGERVPHVSGQQHWREMLANPRTPISRWHSLEGIARSSMTLERSKKRPAT